MRDRDPASTFSTILAAQAQDIPDELVYIFLRDGETDEQRMTYRELNRRAAGFATSLAAAVEPGGRALLILPPGLDYVAALFGCFHAGVVAVSAAPPHPARLHRTLPRLLAIAEDAEAHCVLTTPEIKEIAEPFLGDAGQALSQAPWLTETTEGDLREHDWGSQPRPRSELAFLQYTSGSTNTPRGVMLTHQHLVGMCCMISEAWELTLGRDLGFNWLPPYHDMGLISVLQPTIDGGASILTSPLSIMKHPLRWLKGISRYKVTTSGGPNFAYDLCVERFNEADCEGLDLSSWDIAANGSEPVRASTLDAFDKCFAPYGFKRQAFFPCYGLAEATLLVTGIPRGQEPTIKEFSARALERGEVTTGTPGDTTTLVGCGSPYDGHLVAIVDPETLERCRPGRVGEIWVAGWSVTEGYWHRTQETGEAFGFTITGEPGESRYVRTGDLGVQVDGELFVVGRIKDILILNGRNIHPHDIELSAETAHPLLRRHCSAAFGIDGPLSSRFGVVIEVNASDVGSANNDVLSAVRHKIAADLDLQVDLVALCMPRSVPKTTSGKVQRGLCQKLLRDGELELAGEWRRNGGA
jgi:acyl-CoA synthetase (AMP-forming)/AMP-acid ligase II